MRKLMLCIVILIHLVASSQCTWNGNSNCITIFEYWRFEGRFEQLCGFPVATIFFFIFTGKIYVKAAENVKRLEGIRIKKRNTYSLFNLNKISYPIFKFYFVAKSLLIETIWPRNDQALNNMLKIL